MPDSNSLILLPPRQTAQAPADNSSKKTDKPSKDHSFGQKLDKAKKAILTTTAKAPVKTAPQAKEAKNPTPTDDTADAKPDPSADGTDQIAEEPSKSKLPAKPVAKNLKRTNSVENPDEDKNKEEDTTAVKQVAPVETTADRPKKTVKAAPAAVKNAPKSKQTDSSTTQVAQQAVTAINTGNSADDDQTDADSDDDAESTDAIAAVNTQQFGTGKLINHNSLTGASAEAVAGADGSADQQEAATAAVGNAVDPMATAAAEVATTVEQTVTKSLTASSAHSTDPTTDTANIAATPTAQHATTAIAKAAAAPAASPQVQFAEDNHPKIVTGIQGQLMPNGGTMQLQLNPASLGALQVTVHIADGVVTASFETSNDDATKLLSHSLGQLKAGLEAAGVSVEKLHVEQAPQRDTKNDSGGSDSKQAMQDQQKNAQQDQQRREMVQKMWRRLAGGSDPLDLVA